MTGHIQCEEVEPPWCCSHELALTIRPAARPLMLHMHRCLPRTRNRMHTNRKPFLADPLQEIAQIKLPDLNATTIEAAMRIVEGTARNMGIKVEAPAEAAA